MLPIIRKFLYKRNIAKWLVSEDRTSLDGVIKGIEIITTYNLNSVNKLTADTMVIHDNVVSLYDMTEAIKIVRSQHLNKLNVIIPTINKRSSLSILEWCIDESNQGLLTDIKLKDSLLELRDNLIKIKECKFPKTLQEYIDRKLGPTYLTIEKILIELNKYIGELNE